MWIVVWALVLFGPLELAKGAPPSASCAKYATSPNNSPNNLPKNLMDSEITLVDSLSVRIGELIATFENRLGPRANPFDEAFSVSQGIQIEYELKNRLVGSKHVPSPLVGVSEFILKSAFGPWKIETAVIEKLLIEASVLVQDPDAKKRDLQSDLLALKYSLQYVERFKPREEIVDRDGDPVTKPEEKPKDKPKDKKEEKPQKPDRKQIPTRREHPTFPKEYRPHTKDTDNSGGSSGEPVVLAELDFEAFYFGAKNYSEVVRGAPQPFREVDLLETFTKPGPARETGKNMIIQTFGVSTFELMVPPGYRPRQPFDPRAQIQRTGSGGYRVFVNPEAGLTELRIPMEIDDGLVLMPQLLEHYTRPVGFNQNEWPDLVKAAILHKFNPNEGRSRGLEIAKAIQDHLYSSYLYSVDSSPETDPIDALKKEKFQCDIAAYAMLGILRDVYKIPSRIRGGVKAKLNKKNRDSKSYLVLPAEGHAWVEVFVGGRWHVFDPTPGRKDRETKSEDDEENPFADRPPEDMPLLPNADKACSVKGAEAGGEDDGEGKSEDHLKEVQKTSEKRIKEVIGDSKKALDNKTQSAVHEPEDKSVKVEDLADRLNVGSLTLTPPLHKNPLVLRAMRQVIKTSLDPTRTGSEIATALSILGRMIKSDSGFSPLQGIYNLALSAHTQDHPSLTAWLERVLSRLKTQDVNETYQELIRIQNAVAGYSQVLDPGSAVKPSELQTALGDVLKSLSAMAHPDASDMALVEDLVRNLPSVPRQILNQKYGFSTVGANAPTQAIANALKENQLADLRLLSILTPMANFILGSSPRPEYQEFPTWLEDPSRRTRQDLLPFSRWSDITRVILGQPEKNLDQNIVEGTAFVPTRRQRVRVPTGFGREEAERITLVLFDTSGSMLGDPARFQAALIGAFSGVALSDVTRSGRIRHKVVLLPFDGKPGIPIVIDTVAKALDVIRNYQTHLKNTNGGTDIEAALIEALGIIATAQKNQRDPLAAANIILMSDGEATVDTERVMKARQAISRLTPLQLMFVAINKTNPDLIRLAYESGQMGAERGHYREFDAERITKILAEADSVDLEKVRQAFYTDQSARSIPSEVAGLLSTAIDRSKKLSDQIFKDNQISTPEYHFDRLQLVRANRDLPNGRNSRPLEEWLTGLRKFALSPLFKNRTLLAHVVDDLVTKFKILTLLDLQSDLTGYELEHVRHLLRYAAGYETGTGEAIGPPK